MSNKAKYKRVLQQISLKCYENGPTLPSMKSGFAIPTPLTLPNGLCEVRAGHFRVFCLFAYNSTAIRFCAVLG